VGQQILEVFIEAIRQVFGDTGIIIDTVDAEQEPIAEDHVVTSVGITGDLKGIFMLRTDTPSASFILRAMTDGLRIALEDDSFSEIHMAALGELTNQITGRAITLLFDRQLRCEITPPAVIAARQLHSLVPDMAVSFSRAVRGPFGRLTLFLGMLEPQSVEESKKLVDNS
jgi:CheY-specific phosphatase CheX